MDILQVVATSIGVIVFILFVILFACHFFGPKRTAWICSNREEKIGFSNCRLYHANGYLIPSGSEFLLNSTGSFKRFDSVDRDYKQVGQTSLSSPSLNANGPNIPPQPLRPAPAPLASPNDRKKAFERPVKQQSCDTNNKNVAIPRPVAKRQHSSPARYGVTSINLSESVSKLSNKTRSSSTNPFLNGSLSIPEDDNAYIETIPKIASDSEPNMTVGVVDERQHQHQETFFHKNPFASLQMVPNHRIFGSSNGNDIFDEAKKLSDNEKDSENQNHNKLVWQTGGIATETTMTENSNVVCMSELDALASALQKQQFRNRSFSDTESTNNDLKILRKQQVVNQAETNPFTSNLQKTLSETYLEQFHWNRTRSGSQTLSFENGLVRNGSNQNITRSNASINYETNDMDLKRALSCDSVNSDSSVILADLEQTAPLITGMLCVGLQFDKNTMTDDGIELMLTVMEAKELIGPQTSESFDTFVRIYLVPDEPGALQTKLFKNSVCPSFNETFAFWLDKKYTRRSLWFHLYHSGSVHTLIGETELQIGDVRRPITTWLALSDSQHNKSVWGELMFSLSYLPTAERLTVVVVKARNLNIDEIQSAGASQSVFVKAYLLKNNKKVSKKKTSSRRCDRSLIYNESMIFSVPSYMLNSIQVRLTVVRVMDGNGVGNGGSGSSGNATINQHANDIISLGHVIVGSSSCGKGLRHWNQMLTSLRKPVAMWHPMRQISSSERPTKIVQQLSNDTK